MRLYANPNDYTTGYYSTVPGDGVGPDYYFTAPILQSGQSQTLTFGTNSGNTNVDITYAGMTFNTFNFTLTYNAYFGPPTTGTYTFCIAADDVDNFYLGSDTAFPCSSPSTPVAGATPFFSIENQNGQVCKPVQLVAGAFYPIRSIYGQLGGPYKYTVDITYPGASAPQSDVSPNLYSAFC